jgi:hypothetical protein
MTDSLIVGHQLFGAGGAWCNSRSVNHFPTIKNMFTNLKKLVQEQFVAMQKLGALLQTDTNRDQIWSAYLSAFPEELQQEHNCNCCKSFIRQVGNVVIITPDLQIVSIWDVDVEQVSEELRAPVKALRDYVLSCPIRGLFHVVDKDVGKDRNFSEKHQVVFEHFFSPVPSSAFASNVPTLSGEVRESRNVFMRGLIEITDEALQIVLELIAQGSLYRGNDYKHLLQGLQDRKAQLAALPPEQREAFFWHVALTRPAAEVRVKNTSIGTLLTDLSEGKELEVAVKAFEKMVAPANYKRPTALVTPRMVEDAKKTLEGLGMLSALERRRLDTRDLGPHNALFVHRGTEATKDVFAKLTEEAPVKVQSLSKCEAVSIEVFQKDILPSCKSIRLLVENRHMGNFATLTGAVDPAANNIFKWESSFGWSYTGGVADSIKERVKAAGGKVDGWGRISLSWSNFDDLDLALVGKGQHVYYANKISKSLSAQLDVDMNAGRGHTRQPVENIHIASALPDGDYSIQIKQFSQRETTKVGYELEIEMGGERFATSVAQSPKGTDRIDFKMAQGACVLDASKFSHHSRSVAKWNVMTQQWRTVKAITLSPNHWNKPTGNKHWFFMLEGCVSDEETRPFYNEFLCDELSANRKVMEVLASKITVASAEGAELSGLGFSETIRNEVYLEVEGAFKRVIKVTF